MPWSKILREIGTISFSDNGKDSLELPLDFAYAGLFAELDGEVVVAVANADAAFAQSPYSLVKRIEVVLNGKDTIHSAPAYYYQHLARLAHRTEPKVTVPGITTGTRPFRVSFPIPFLRTRGANPLDSFLYAPRLGTINLHVTWGTGTDLLDPAATTTLAIQNTDLKIWGLELSDLPVQVLTEQDRRTLWHRHLEFEVTAATSRRQVRLPVGTIYRAFHILTTADAGTGGGPVPVDTVINSIRLTRGTETLHEWDGDVLQELNKLGFGMETWPTGWYVVDREVLGLIGSGLNTAGFSDLFMEFDVNNPSGTVKVEIFPEEIIIQGPWLSNAN